MTNIPLEAEPIDYKGTEVKNKKTIYLDMDGVIVNFVKGVSFILADNDMHFNWTSMRRGHDLTLEESYDMAKMLGLTPSYFWKQIDKRPTFWDGLHSYPWMKELMDMLHKQGNVVLLSSPSMSPDCVRGKTEWIQRELGNYYREYIFCPAKHKLKLAGPDTLLIDDSTKNVNDFINAGGHALLFPQPWNTAYELVHEEYGEDHVYTQAVIDYMERQLDG